ncbi:unnamed protein product, partial [Polarella glacialis]
VVSALGLFAHVAQAQYDFPIDNCACHIHYEHWVQLQLQLSTIMDRDFPQRLVEDEVTVRAILRNQACVDVRKVSNVLEWTLAPASTSDCAPGHLSSYILCAQEFLSRGDLEGARLYFDFANYLLPMAIPCMDPVIWTITPEDFYLNHQLLARAAEERAGLGKSSADLQKHEIKALAWRSKRSAPHLVR